MLAMGDSALGFWSALRELEEFIETKEQRCWVHKIANVLNKLPKRVQRAAKSLLHEMMKAPDRKSADLAKARFTSIFSDKYEKSVQCLDKDWGRLTTFFDFPAKHWISIRTTNPIESSFATVKLRTKTTRGAGSPKTGATMAFKLLQECERKWRRIRGWEEIKNLLAGVEYRDGVVVASQESNQEAAATRPIHNFSKFFDSPQYVDHPLYNKSLKFALFSFLRSSRVCLIFFAMMGHFPEY